MAGPNGAGKTTTSRLILTGDRQVAEFVNADIIASEQGLDDLAAGRVMLERLDALTCERKDIAFETTLSSSSLRNRISAMQRAGYTFTLVYVWLPTPEMSIERIAARVRAGGHHIPEDVIRRRYPRSLANLFNVFMLIVEDVFQAACRAVDEALARHKSLGQSVVVWEDGRVVVLSPEEIAT